MTTAIKKLTFQADARPFRVRFAYQKSRFTSSTIFAIYCSADSFEIAIFKFFIVLGISRPVEPSPLTDEERAMLVEMNDE